MPKLDDALPGIFKRSRGLMLVGLAFTIAFALLIYRPPEGPTTLAYYGFAFAFFLAAAGTITVFLELRATSSASSEDESIEDATDLQHVVRQLGRNYDLLRRQTTHGFIFAGTFMALGICVILVGAVGHLVGFTREGSALTIVAGVVVDVVSGLGLYLFNQTFKQMNAVSERLFNAWSVLTAFTHIDKLPENKRPDVIADLIRALIDRKAV